MPGDDPAVIGSGPTVPDPTTLADARAIVARYRLDLPDAVTRALADPANETPKPGDPVFAHRRVQAGRAAGRRLRRGRSRRARAPATNASCSATASRAKRATVAAEHARLALDAAARRARRAVILSGGELTVTIRGKGRGGPNQEYALALAIALDGAPGSRRSPADTDGTDGGGGTPTTRPAPSSTRPRWPGRAALGLDPAAFLADNNSTGFFEQLGDLSETGPTCTNVNDFRAILVDSA